MGREWTIKSFKSGNSVAMRMPAPAGIAPGEDWRLVEDGDGYRLEKISRPKRKFNVAKVAGSATSLAYINDQDRLFEDRPLLWREIAARRGESGE